MLSTVIVESGRVIADARFSTAGFGRNKDKQKMAISIAMGIIPVVNGLPEKSLAV